MDIIELFANWTYIPSTRCMQEVCRGFGIETTQYKMEKTRQHLLDKGLPLYNFDTRVIKRGRAIIIPIAKQ